MSRNYLLNASLLAASLLGASALVQAHATLERAQPKANSTVAVAPVDIRLQFNEALEAAFSKIDLVDARQAPVPVAKIAIDPARPTVMTVALPRLAPGRYEVRWSAMTHDGHKVKGHYLFTIKPA